MKHIIFTFSILLIALKFQSQTIDWLRGMGGTGDDGAFSVTTDALGNVYTTGYFSDTLDFDPGAGTYTLASAGGSDIYVSKLDAAGNFVWAKRFGKQLNDYGVDVATDASGNVFVCGIFKDTVDFDPGPGINNLNASPWKFDGFVLKLDPGGNFVWAAEIGGPDDDHAISLAIDASGNVHVTGHFMFTADFDPGQGTYNLTTILSNIFVWKLSNSGNFIWARSMGGSGKDFSYTIALDAAGNVYTAGSFVGVADFDPGPATYTLASSAGVGCSFVSKLDASGGFVWAIPYLSTNVSESAGLAVTPNSELIVTGVFKGTIDLDPGPGAINFSSLNFDGFVVKINSGTGNTVWANTITGPSDQFGIGTEADAAGNIYVTGHYVGPTDFDPWAGIPNVSGNGGNDIFMCTFDGAGNLMSIFTAGGPGNDWGYALDVSSTGEVYLAGGYAGSVVFGSSIYLTAAGDVDSFVLKFKDCSSMVTAPPANGTLPVGATAQFGIASPGAFFQWQENTGSGFYNLSNNQQYMGVNMATLTISNVALTQNSYLYRCLVSSASCSLASAIATLSVYDDTGLDESAGLTAFALHPNPATDRVLLQAPSTAKGLLYTLSDQTGRLVLSGTIEGTQTSIDLSGLSPGLYMVRVNGFGIRPKKIIKQ